MDILKKTVRAATSSKKETLIKNNIKYELSNIIKEIQLYSTQESFSNNSLCMTEAQNGLCTVVEAIFLHGLKDSLIHRARRAITDIEQKPEPSFWAPLLIVSHRQIIEQISKLTQITTEIGQCRAWVRTTLNDSLLSSYFSILRNDSSALKSYYNVYAYVRDSELLDISQKIVEGVEAVTQFSFPCNSSLFNTWQLQSLILAGIWSPTLRALPVAAGMDIAQSLQSTSAVNSETCSISSAMSFASHSSGLPSFLTFTEDEALREILSRQSTDKKSNLVQPLREKENESNSSAALSELQPQASSTLSETVLGNSLNRKATRPFSETVDNLVNSECTNIDATEVHTGQAVPMEKSYHAIIESYNNLSGSTIKTPDFQELLLNFEEQRNSKKKQESSRMEIVADFQQNIKEVPYFDPPTLDSCIIKIARERGMDVQNYECASCNQTLGLTNSSNTCNYTGEYFCDKCMGVEVAQIPARIIHNWDFTTYRISIKAYTYLEEIKDLPLVDIKEANIYIYMVADDMAKLQTLRIQLNFLRDYLYTCGEPIMKQLQELINGKDYMYEHIHKYSVSDLVEVRNGLLIQHLQKVVDFGIEHVHTCGLCSQKGFFCEICSKSKVLYPFDLDYVYRCGACRAVYHNTCLNCTQSCPKCERKRKAELLQLQE